MPKASHVSYALLSQIFQRDGGGCQYCGKELTLYGKTYEDHTTRQPFPEHKIPVSRGGTSDAENLVIACRTCNSQKGTKTEDEYRQWLRNAPRG